MTTPTPGSWLMCSTPIAAELGAAWRPLAESDQEIVMDGDAGSYSAGTMTGCWCHGALRGCADANGAIQRVRSRGG